MTIQYYRKREEAWDRKIGEPCSTCLHSENEHLPRGSLNKTGRRPCIKRVDKEDCNCLCADFR